MAAVRLKAFDKRMTLLKDTDNFTQEDIFWTAAQPEPAARPPLGDNKSSFGKIVDDLDQVISRNCKLNRNFVRCKKALGIACQTHQSTKPKIGKLCESHNISPEKVE
jgi:hypothetical protein